MAVYVATTDGNDRTLILTDADCVAADDFVNAQLLIHDIDPGLVDKSNRLLKSIALHYAYYAVATRSVVGESSQIADKASMYRRLWQDEILLLSRKTLGLPESVTSVTPAFTIPLARS